MYKYTYIYLVYKKVGYSWEYQEYPVYPPMLKMPVAVDVREKPKKLKTCNFEELNLRPLAQ